jgi:hypothetical protein
VEGQNLFGWWSILRRRGRTDNWRQQRADVLFGLSSLEEGVLQRRNRRSNTESNIGSNVVQICTALCARYRDEVHYGLPISDQSLTAGYRTDIQLEVLHLVADRRPVQSSQVGVRGYRRTVDQDRSGRPLARTRRELASSEMGGLFSTSGGLIDGVFGGKRGPLENR